MTGGAIEGYDWRAIRRYYEAGHTVAECRRRFGFGGSSWARVVSRGDVVARPSRGSRSDERRQVVGQMVSQGASRVEIADRLDVSLGTVAHYVRTLGLPMDERCARRYDWAEVQRYHDLGHSTRECMARFGFTSQTWHQARRRGDLLSRPPAAPIATYLVKGRRVGRGHLKKRLLVSNMCIKPR